MIDQMYENTVPTSTETTVKEDKAYYYFKILLKKWDKDDLRVKEEIKALFLDNLNKPLKLVSIPDLTSDLKEIFKAAQKENATSIVLAKSDPLDNLSLDQESDFLIQKFKTASKGFSIRFNDLLVFSRWGYASSLENKKL